MSTPNRLERRATSASTGFFYSLSFSLQFLMDIVFFFLSLWFVPYLSLLTDFCTRQPPAPPIKWTLLSPTQRVCGVAACAASRTFHEFNAISLFSV